jgi:two-component system sensor histidine kinase RegB
VSAPHPHSATDIAVTLQPSGGSEPVVPRNPGILYGLGNLIENAVDFARSRVEITAEWSESAVTVTIADDGPGFASEILDRLGEPYITTRHKQSANDGEPSGLGLGIFIAKTLLERSGASLIFRNRIVPRRGAMVIVHWKRSDFERLPLDNAA